MCCTSWWLEEKLFRHCWHWCGLFSGGGANWGSRFCTDRISPVQFNSAAVAAAAAAPPGTAHRSLTCWICILTLEGQETSERIRSPKGR